MSAGLTGGLTLEVSILVQGTHGVCITGVFLTGDAATRVAAARLSTSVR